jgi:hypothetical protein
LLFIVSGASFVSKKIKEQKNTPLGSEIQDPEKIHPGSESRIQGVKKHRIRICNTASGSKLLQLAGRSRRPSAESLQVEETIPEISNFIKELLEKPADGHVETDVDMFAETEEERSQQQA